jgi:hypothetical protein
MERAHNPRARKRMHYSACLVPCRQVAVKMILRVTCSLVCMTLRCSHQSISGTLHMGRDTENSQPLRMLRAVQLSLSCCVFCCIAPLSTLRSMAVTMPLFGSVNELRGGY